MPKGIPKNGINKGWFTRERMMGNVYGFTKGHKHSIETINKIRESSIVRGAKPPTGRKEFHSQWIKDRTKVKGIQNRNNPEYKNWRMRVWMRDCFKCRIDNKDCVGRIEAHHILGWKSNPVLRYKINNGITLCHAHHPKRRAEEKRLIPEFQELVSVSK